MLDPFIKFFVELFAHKIITDSGENRNRTCEAFTPSRFQGGVLDQPDSLQTSPQRTSKSKRLTLRWRLAS